MTVVKRTTKEILNRNLARAKPPLLDRTTLWLHDIRSMYNVGSAFRTGDAFGINQICLSGYTPQPPRPEISKTALGAEKCVTWNHYSNGAEALSNMKAQDSYLVSIEQTNHSKPLTDFHLPEQRPVILIFGNEVTGLDEDILHLANEYIEIPQFGQKHSFNVSVSIGIVLYHIFLSGHKGTEDERS